MMQLVSILAMRTYQYPIELGVSPPRLRARENSAMRDLECTGATRPNAICGEGFMHPASHSHPPSQPQRAGHCVICPQTSGRNEAASAYGWLLACWFADVIVINLVMVGLGCMTHIPLHIFYSTSGAHPFQLRYSGSVHIRDSNLIPKHGAAHDGCCHLSEGSTGISK